MIDENTNVTPDQARELIKACFADIRQEVEARPAFMPETTQPELELEEQAFLAAEEVSRLSLEIESDSFSASTSKAARRILAMKGVELEGLSQHSQRLLLNGIVRVLVEGQRLSLARLQDPLAAYEPSDPLFQAISRDNVKETELWAVGPSIDQAIPDYLGAKRSQWVRKTFAARVVHLGYFRDFLGPSKRLGDVTPTDIRAYRKALTMLRANHGRQRHLTFQERLTENVEARIKNKTASLIFEPVKAFLRWAHEEEGLLAANPAANIRWQITSKAKFSPTRRPFGEDELVTLFGSPLFVGSHTKHRRFDPGEIVVRDAKYWIPIIGYYTGMRLGEIVQLHVSDAFMGSEIPHFDLNEKSESGDPKHIKTAAGIRKVPLHPDLLALGFANFVAERRKWNRPCKRLFSEVTLGADGQASTQFSKFFARLLDQVGLTDTALTFHSFRHGAEDAFRNASLPQYVIDSVMGHSDGKVSSSYGEGPSLSLKADAIKAMNLPVRLPAILRDNTSQDSRELS